jgi:AcrR family transcriptional regulator
MYKKGYEATGDIVATADKLFQQRGFQNTSFQHLADGSGVPKGNFYHYFRTKDDVLTAVVEDRVTQLEEQLKKLEQDVGDPLLRLEGFVQSLLKDPTDPFIYGCPHGSLCMELAKGRSDLLRKGSKVLVRLKNWFSEQFWMAGVADSGNYGLRLLSRIQGIILVTAVFHDEEFAMREILEVCGWVGSLQPANTANSN